MSHRNILLIGILFFYIGCSSKTKEINLDSKPMNQIPTKIKKKKPNFKGSLYSRAGGSLFADKQDLQVGDILQVNISESLKNDTKNTRALTKTNTTALGGGLFAPVKGVTNTVGTTKRINQLNNSLGVGFNSSTANSFAGSSTTKADEKFSTVISVVISRIFQNGNYFIKGEKEILINDQKQNIAISGVIRPYDISPENTILSSQIANLKILYKKDGEDNESLNKGWGTRFLEFIWPF
jgi:flagellar L-ring protein precursor FlgH